VVISAIEGMAGVGKTQLAIHAAHALVRSGRYTDAQFYVNLRGFDADQPPTNPAAVLDSFLRQLGVPGNQIPEQRDARVAMFRDRIHGSRTLIVLDNASDEDQVRDMIPGSPTCLVLITSRRSLAGLEGASLHLLDAFSTSEAVGLLRALAGGERIDAEPQAAERVAELCGYLPLAVALAAARLRSRPTWGVADLVERLSEGGVDAICGDSRSPRKVFALSYAGLTEPARQMFALFGIHPGEDLSREAVAALAGVEWTRARHLLETLQDEHLLQQKSPGRYSLHDLLRTYAASIAVEQHDPDPAIIRLLMYYLDTADRADRCLVPVPQPQDRELPAGCRPLEFSDRDQALRWFDAEYDNLLAALRLAATKGHHLVATELPVMMGGYFALRGSIGDWIAALQLSVDSATVLGDTARIGGALNRLGMALTEGGRHQDAAEALTRAVELGKTLEDGRLWMTARTNLAVVQERLGNLEEAARLLHEVLPDQRRVGNRVSEGVSLENLGKVHLRMADYELAIDYCEQAIAIFRETDRDGELANALNIIGQAHRESGRLTEAEHSHRQALAVNRALGTRRAEGHSLCQLGLTLRAKGEEAPATACLQAALEAYTEVGDPRATDVAKALHLTADTGNNQQQRRKPSQTTPH
jgi:tetratricopeptide (TPR) repeat protein